MEIAKRHYVTTFYQFIPLSNPEDIKAGLLKVAADLEMKGLVILGKEGINSTVSALSPETLESFKAHIRSLTQNRDLFFKDSVSDIKPFRRFTVKIRDEIVTLKTPELVPDKNMNFHLSPKEWDRVLKEEKENILLIDTRNWYETQIGTFKGSDIPPIEQFADFPSYVEEKGVPKDKKVLIFCTGGIRCEKGILEMQRKGYHNTFQLDGGIINYIKEFPNQEFEGECFVFDRRVALDQNLQPTKKFALCPHDGQPAWTEITCRRCGSPAKISVESEKDPLKAVSCSKHCAYRLSQNFDEKGPKQFLPELDSDS
ncbi:MAG: rhodanese-like domain-containing protein, partial [Pseudobdellovibrionaceae bacterium]